MRSPSCSRHSEGRQEPVGKKRILPMFLLFSEGGAAHASGLLGEATEEGETKLSVLHPAKPESTTVRVSVRLSPTPEKPKCWGIGWRKEGKVVLKGKAAEAGKEECCFQPLILPWIHSYGEEPRRKEPSPCPCSQKDMSKKPQAKRGRLVGRKPVRHLKVPKPEKVQDSASKCLKAA